MFLYSISFNFSQLQTANFLKVFYKLNNNFCLIIKYKTDFNLKCNILLWTLKQRYVQSINLMLRSRWRNRIQIHVKISVFYNVKHISYYVF